jgi:hypothetical protein
MSLPLQRLRELPYPAQISAIDVELATGRAGELLRELCSYRDYQPLAYALASLADKGALADVDTTLIPLLLGIPDTGLRRVLRALDEVEAPASFTQALADGAWQLSVDRIAAVAMIDRWLKNTDATDRRIRAESGLAHCRERISRSEIQQLSDAHLMRIPGTALSSLDRLAQEAGCLEAWQRRQRDFAEQLLDVLEDQPKSLSQANAEELLSRQVYTDPGHFLVELLQNADDAGASVWRVQVFDDRIEVEHDGTPFDALDVVGILSIGQTTKSKEQIGFFGVGFKSVYEICERPQLYSGVYSLEIADVSIPRPLRPIETLAPGHTLLVLPLRQGRDESISPERLFRTLAELPAEVVLTLNSVRELDLRYGDHTRHVRGRDAAPGRFHIDDGEHRKQFLVERTEAHYDGSRGTHRASRTPVLVAVSLDSSGVPTAIRDAPTIYSYLPTHERSGLRVLVHAHFDLPVDRERIDLSSDWNQWALSQAGLLLAKAIARLCEDSRDTDSEPQVLDALMSIISLPAELSHRAFEAVAGTLSTLPFLPGADGGRHAAAASLVCEDGRIRHAFAEVAMQDGRRLLRNLTGRDADVAKWLGVAHLEFSAVVDEIVRCATQQKPGAPFSVPWEAHIAQVAAALSDSGVSLARLRDVACLPDSEGDAQKPHALHRAQSDLRGFLTPVHSLVRADLEAPQCSTFLDTLDVPVLRIRDLVALCSEIETARRVIEHVGAPALIAFLQAAPPAELEMVAFANIIPDDRGSISAVGEVWLTGTSPLAELVRKMPIRPRLVERDTENLLFSSLKSIGCPIFGIPAILDSLADGRLQIAEDSLVVFHEAFDRVAHDIAPNIAKRLARTALFPVHESAPLPLLGTTVANIPYDEELTRLWPHRQWLLQDVARIPYIRSLGAPVVGPEQLAASLLSQPVPLERRKIFAYLTRHANVLSATVTESLARAPLWPDIHGTLRPLDALRRQAERPSVAALYDIWPRAMTVEAGDATGSVVAFAAALHLDHRIVAPTLATAIQDLRNSIAQEAGPYRGGDGLDLDDPTVTSIVATLLNEAAESLPRTTLSAICEAPIFLCSDGQRRRLGAANKPLPGRALRVNGPLVPAFESLGFSVLDAEASKSLEPLLDALLLRPATLLDLVRETSNGGRDLTEAAAVQFRRALCSGSVGLATLDESLRAEVSSLAMWPCHGKLVPATAVVRGHSFDALLETVGLNRASLGDAELSLVDSSAEDQAQTLQTVLDFAAPIHLLANVVRDTARVDEPLRSQEPLLANLEQVARLAAVLAQEHPAAWTLPISVNAEENLVARELVLATEDEVRASAGLPLRNDLAHVAWSKIATEASTTTLPLLGTRRLLDAMREVSGEAGPAENHATLATAAARNAFYRWLLAQADFISNDEQSLGLLGKSAVILSEKGVLRAPRELLFDTSLPDLGIDWNPAKEISEPLQEWLRSTYRPASKQLRPIVDHMLEAIDDAANGGDRAKIASILEHLATLMRAGHETGELEELAKRFKLRKRLRVETEDGQFEFARRLLAAEPLDADLVPRFSLAPPPSAAHKYRKPQTLRLLRAAGAADELGIAALRSYLEGTDRCVGSDSGVAFACYLASAAHRQPSLRSDLGLRHETWLPDALGDLHAANSLYWPTPELETLIGESGHLYVHPEFVLRVPEAHSWLPLRKADDAALTDIASYLRTCAAHGEPAAGDALVWLDAQLAENKLSKKDVHAALVDIPMLVDDYGQLRRASELIVAGGRRLFGARRGNWSAGARLRHLAEALAISRRPQAKDVLAVLEQIHREFVAHPEGLQNDIATLEMLPRCLDALVELGARGPRQLPVAAMHKGQHVLVVLPISGRVVGLPQQGDDADLVLRLADGADMYAWKRFLRPYGVGPAIDEEPDAADPRAFAPPTEPKNERRPQSPHGEEEEPEGPGVISRLRSWFRGNDDDDDQSSHTAEPMGSDASSRHRTGRETGSETSAPPPSDSEPPPFRPVDQRAWFRGERSLSSQLASNPSWLADRTQVAEFGLAHSPHQLPVPHRYAPNAIFASFDKRRQQWKPLRCDPKWRQGGGPAGRLHMRGKLPSPEARVPMPLYGRFVESRSNGEARVVEGPHAIALLSKSDPTITITIDLDEPPNFSEATKGGNDKQLCAFSVADRELPEEVHDLVESLQREDSALQVAGIIRSFVRRRYVYDPTYLEDPQMAAWLQERSAGRSNIHIAALHAGGDAKFLGRGVCYELNALVCEMLRRAGVQAGVATGWTFDRGYIDEPDHLWAMALVQTSAGPRWLPVDASTTQSGRPLHAAHRPPGPWRADKRKARPLQEPKWDTTELDTPSVESLPLGDLLRVARYLESATGRHLGSRGEILAACREILSDTGRREALTDLLGRAATDDDAE